MLKKALIRSLDIFYYLKMGTSPYTELNKLKKYQYLDKPDLDFFVDKKLRGLLIHAKNNVPFYHDLYNEIDIIDIDSTSKLEKLPVTNKPMFRATFPEKNIATNLKSRAIYDVTSGSTGEPFEFYRDKMASPLTQASYRFFNTWMGIGSNSRFVHIKTPSTIKDKTKVRDWIFERNRISVFDINREMIQQVVDNLNKVNPIFIEGYTASLVHLAMLISDSELELKIHPKAVIATSENLTEAYKETIKDVFHCNVFNRYGSREFSGAIAQECDIFEGLHVNPILCHLEIVDENNETVGEGEEGKILVTDLNNWVMPFIRYDIGDAAIKGPDTGECGRTFPIIKNVLGRTGQFIITKNNEKIPLLPITSTLFQTSYAPHVYNFQFIQEEKGKISVNIVPTKKFDESVMKGISDYLTSVLPSFDISVNIVDYIPQDKSGKKLFFIPLKNI